MITSEDLNLMGFKEVDENEWTNNKVTLFVMGGGVSIISDTMEEELCLSVPHMVCEDASVLIDFLERTGTL